MNKKSQSKITELSESKIKEGIVSFSGDSYKWLEQKIKQVRNPALVSRNIIRDTSRQVNASTNKFLVGGLYFFYYNPKHKDTLPYYDIFPLVIPLQKHNDGFLGLNLHYLPISYRVAFLNKLKVFSIDQDEEIKRLRVTYDILNATRRFREFKPCVKKYLTNHIRSKIITVNPGEWDIALHLPVQQFRKESPKVVWQESVKKIRES